MNVSLEGKRALVTGAASGIGRAIAEAYGREGAIVAVHGRTEPRVAETVAAIEAAGGEAFAAAADLADADAIDAMCGEALARLDGLDILVNNAGVSRLAPVSTMTTQTWDEIFQTNLRAPFLVTRALLPALVASGREASVIFISSIAANARAKGWGAYAASKSGLDAFMRCLADELGPHGVRVNAISPGWVETKMATSLHEGMAAETGRAFDQLYDESMRGNMLRARLTPSTIADMAVYLASEHGRFITAQTLDVCGGDVPGRRLSGSDTE